MHVYVSIFLRSRVMVCFGFLGAYIYVLPAEMGSQILPKQAVRQFAPSLTKKKATNVKRKNPTRFSLDQKKHIVGLHKKVRAVRANPRGSVSVSTLSSAKPLALHQCAVCTNRFVLVSYPGFFFNV